MADFENNNQETMDGDFCLLEDADDMKGESDDFSHEVRVVEDDFCLIEDADDLTLDVKDNYHEFSMLSCKSKPGSLVVYNKAPKYLDGKKARLEDVLRDHALRLLPAKSLLRFKTVSRGWDQWISSPLFAHQQTTYFKNMSGLFCQVADLDPSFISFDRDAYGVPDPSLKFLPEPIYVRTSCNGLLCCQSVADDVYYICNPVTKEWKMLPKPKLYHGAKAAIVLVFEPRLLDFNEAYELVCAVTFPDHQLVYFEIYSSRSSSWRVSDTICCEIDCLELDNGGYYMNGVVYWESSSSVVLAFSLREEQYGILPLPANDGLFGNGTLSMNHGELCYIQPSYENNVCTINIHGNMDMSLKTVINLTYDAGSTYGDCKALGFINDDILILALGTNVISYHVREQKVELISTSESCAFTRYVPYVNSLASARHPLIREKGLIV